MTPKEKAKELVQEFRFRIDEHFQPTNWDEVKYHNIILDRCSKDCAELSVIEILDEIQPFELSWEYAEKMQFWNNVKQEIEKL